MLDTSEHTRFIVFRITWSCENVFFGFGEAKLACYERWWWMNRIKLRGFVLMNFNQKSASRCLSLNELNGLRGSRVERNETQNWNEINSSRSPSLGFIRDTNEMISNMKNKQKEVKTVKPMKIINLKIF